MARPLTKIGPQDELYTRPSLVEAQIDEALSLSRTELQSRVLIADRTDPGYMSSECLVYFVREGRRSGDQELMSIVLPILLGRCESNLVVKIRDCEMPDAALVRQQILEELTDLFVTDGTGEFPNELDFYECRFNLAFRALRIDAVRGSERKQKRSIQTVDLPSSEATIEPDAYEDGFARVSENFKVLPSQEWDVFREPFMNAIEALPDDEREAVILVHVLGYKEESENPDEETAATRCNCTGRTIRNRLSRAAAKLSRFKEDL